jgi:hypothetical protein
MKQWQHGGTGRVCESDTKPEGEWYEIPEGCIPNPAYEKATHDVFMFAHPNVIVFDGPKPSWLNPTEEELNEQGLTAFPPEE